MCNAWRRFHGFCLILWKDSWMDFFSCKTVKLWKFLSDRGCLLPPSLVVSQIESLFSLGSSSQGKGDVGDEVSISKHGLDPYTNTTFPLPWFQLKAGQTSVLWLVRVCTGMTLGVTSSHQPEVEKCLNTNLFCTCLVLLMEEGRLCSQTSFKSFFLEIWSK